MKNSGKMIAVVAASSLLAGCQSFPFAQLGFGKARSARIAPKVQDGPEFSAAVLADGRAQLRSGQISAAVASFRIAALDPTTQADANNGLGVAYAKLGRPDLANRFFRTAAMLEPGNPKFAANLARLQNNVYFAQQEQSPAPEDQPAELALAAAQPKLVEVVKPAVLAVADHVSIQTTPEARLTRVSRGEIHINSGSQEGAAPTMKVEYRSAKARDNSDRADTLAAAVEAQYPVRVPLTGHSKSIRPAYPVRIDLTK